MKKKIARFLKQTATGLMAATLAISSPLSAFAIGGNNAGNNAAGVVTGAGGDFSANITGDNTSGKIGIRMTLVDAKDPQKIISVDDNGNPRVIDMLYVNEDTFDHQTMGMYHSNLEDRYTYVNPKTQDLKTLADGGIDLFTVPYHMVTEMLNGTSMPPWLIHENGKYTSKGESYSEWLLPGSTTGGTGQLFTVTALGYEIPVAVYVDEGKKDVITESVYHYDNFGTESIEDYEMFVQESFAYFDRDELQETLRKHQSASPNDENRAMMNFCNELIGRYCKLSGILAAKELRGENVTEFRERLVDVFQNIVDFGVGPGFRTSVIKALEETTQKRNEYAFNEAKAAEAAGKARTPQGTSDSLQGTQGTNTESTISHIETLLQGEIGGSRIFQTPSMLSGAKDTEGNPVTIQTCEEDWVLLVEPLIWLTIFPEGTDHKAIHTKMYGTITNFAQAFVTDPILQPYANSKTFNWKALNMPVWWALTVNDNGFVFGSHNDTSEGRTTSYPLAFYPVESALTYRSFQQLANSLTLQNKTFTVEIDGVQQQVEVPSMEGWGVNCFWKGNIFPSIVTTAKLFNRADKPVTVAKWYVIEQRDPDGTLTSQQVVDVKTGSISNTLAIVNEPLVDGKGLWEVNKWATGKDASAVPSEGDLTSTFEEYASKALGTKSGTTPRILDLTSSPDEKVVYVKLVYGDIFTPQAPGGVNVVKVKETSNGNRAIIEKDSTEPGTTYPADNEPGWKYVEDLQTTEVEQPVTAWDEVPTEGTQGTNPNIEVSDTTQTVYIRYTEQPYNTPESGSIILYENELSRPYTLKSLTADGTLPSIRERFADMSGNSGTCSGGHNIGDDCSSGTDDDGDTYWYCDASHTCTAESLKYQIDDGGYSYRLENSLPYNTFISSFEELNNSWSVTGSVGISGGDTDAIQPDASFLFYRNRVKDPVTLYPGKNPEGIKTLLANSFGYSLEGYAPQKNRYNIKGNGNFFDTFVSNFEYADGVDRTAAWTYTGTYGCSDSGEWDAEALEANTPVRANEIFNKADNCETRWMLGYENKADVAPSNTADKSFTNVFNNNVNTQTQQDGTLSFFPYIKMQAITGTDETSDVYVTAVNKSSLPAYTKIETGVWKNGETDSSSASGNNPVPNIELTSTQWSTHQSSLDFLNRAGVNDKKSVLPGGAIFDVTMNRSNNARWGGESTDAPTTSTKLGYRIWQTCIDDSLSANLASDSTAPTLSEARAQVEAFDKSVKNSVANYGLVQAVAKGITPYKGYLANFLKDSAWQYAYNGADWMSITLNTDGKYYLKLRQPTAEGSLDVDLDTSVANFGIHKGGVVKQIEYTISSDTAGKVSVIRKNSDGTTTVLGSINATQSVSYLLSVPEIKRVDDATKAVTNFVNAVDRNLGSTKEGNPWYNEAFDGITVLYTYLSYDIGLGDGSYGEVSADAKNTRSRTAVLDTYLVGIQNGKADLYNFKSNTNDKVRSSMILTGQVTANGKVKVPDGKLGALTTKNGSTVQVTLPLMETFAYTKMFYIPNANVTDLN